MKTNIQPAPLILNYLSGTGGPAARPPDARPPAMADGGTEIILQILGCVFPDFRFSTMEGAGVAQFKKICNSRERFAAETAH